MGTESYPKRPPVFIARFCRLLAKTCLANELGAESFAMLVTIVSTEDARGYRGPVNFWNGQLLPLIGCRSEGSFRRVRERCERAGWLVHRPGTKTRPPSYWVTVPTQYAGWDDAPTDENTSESASIEPRREQESGENAARIRQESGENAVGIRRDSFPVPVPVPSSAVVPPAVAAPAKPPPRKADRPKPTRPRNELFDALAEVTGSDPTVSGSHVGKLAADLARADPPYTAADVRRFGREFLTHCPWARGERDRPTLGEVQKHVGKLRAVAAAPAADATRIKRASDNPIFDWRPEPAGGVA